MVSNFEIKNFGPIDYGKIELKPLTIFIGPNGSGKSYIAMLIQSIFDSHTRSTMNMPVLLGSIINNVSNENFTKAYLDRFPDLVRQLEEFKSKEQIPVESIEPLMDNIFKTLYEERLGQELVYAFSSPLDELVQIEKDFFEIKIDVGSYSACMVFKKGDKLTLTEHSPIKTNFEEPYKKSIIEALKRIDSKEISSLPHSFVAMLELSLSAIMIYNIMVPELSIYSCHYLPAARSGIILVRKKILTDEYKKNPYFDNKPSQEPQLSGAVSSFIYNIHNLPEKQGPLYDIARELESDLISGEIVKNIQEGHVFPDIKYKYLNNEIPLHRASSTVSELTPIILYLKYLVKKGDVVIIEEPEAHLHPRNQLILAKYLVRLIRTGVKLIITTHSDYLLQKMNNYVMHGEMEPKRTPDYLLPNEVGAYVFEESRPHYYKINKLEVIKGEGISDEDFSKVVESLYDEMIALKEDLRPKGDD